LAEGRRRSGRRKEMYKEVSIMIEKGKEEAAAARNRIYENCSLNKINIMQNGASNLQRPLFLLV
jgi:hypothetical protein